MGTIGRDLDAALHRAVRSGMDRARIAVDPGLGFGKRREQNAEILACRGELAALELPVMVGPSRKSFLAQPESSLLERATAAAATAAILRGAHIVRVADVPEVKGGAPGAGPVLRFCGTSDKRASNACPPRY